MPSAKLSESKRLIIREQPYDAVVKVFLQTKSRFWEKEKLSGFAFTDLPIQRLWAGTVNPAAQEGPAA
jgi:monoamine oxidase